MNHAIEFTSVSRIFGSHLVLDDLSFAVPAGSVFGFLGRNGAGKTTCVRIIAGLIPPTDGDVRVFGRDPYSDDPLLKRKLGLVLEQTGGPKNYWRGGEYLLFFARIFGLPNSDTASRLEHVLRVVDLDPGLLQRPLGILSAGERKRIEVCRALLHHPELLVLDEPTKEFDIPTKRHFWLALQRLAEEERLTIFLCTHDPLEIKTLCTELGVIREGSLVYRGPPVGLDRLETLL